MSRPETLHLLRCHPPMNLTTPKQPVKALLFLSTEGMGHIRVRVYLLNVPLDFEAHNPRITSLCVARRRIKGLALPVKFQNYQVLPCGGVGFPKGLNRSAFAVAVDHERYLTYSAVVGFAKRRVLEFDAGTMPRVISESVIRPAPWRGTQT